MTNNLKNSFLIPSGEIPKRDGYFIDWLSFTLPYEDESELFISDFYGSSSPLKRSMPGYSSSSIHTCGTIVSHTPGNVKNKILVTMSAKALRNFYAEYGYQADDVLNILAQFKYNITRIDITKDDYDGILNIEEMKRKIDFGEVICKFSEYRNLESGSVGAAAKGLRKGHTLYVGSQKSDRYGRIYDKAAQLGALDHWVRVEIQLRRKPAHRVAEMIIDDSFNPSGFLRGFLRFFDPIGDKKEESEFWMQFAGIDEPQKINLPQYDRGLEGVEDWLEKQVTPAMNLIIAARGKEALQEMIERSSGRFQKNERYQRILKNYRRKDNAENA